MRAQAVQQANPLSAAVLGCACSVLLAAASLKVQDPRKQLAEQVAVLRKEINQTAKPVPPPPPPAIPAPPPKELKTLDVYYREAKGEIILDKQGSQPITNAWTAKPPLASEKPPRRLPEPPAPPPPQPPRPPVAAAPRHLAPLQLPLALSPFTALSRGPPPPPPHHPLEHQQQQHVMRPVPGTHALPHLPSSPSLTTASSLQHSGNLVLGPSTQSSGQLLPVGADYIEDEEDQKLTRAQKKNLKRAERKKRAAATETLSITSIASLASSEAAEAAGAQAEADNIMYDLAVQALICNKTIQLVQQLQRLGFPEWQCAAAVQRHGSCLEDAVAWLLEGGAVTPEIAAQSTQSCVPEVSIVDELQLLEALQSSSSVPWGTLCQAVADSGGDLQQAAASVMALHGNGGVSSPESQVLGFSHQGVAGGDSRGVYSEGRPSSHGYVAHGSSNVASATPSHLTFAAWGGNSESSPQSVSSVQLQNGYLPEYNPLRGSMLRTHGSSGSLHDNLQDALSRLGIAEHGSLLSPTANGSPPATWGSSSEQHAWSTLSSSQSLASSSMFGSSTFNGLQTLGSQDPVVLGPSGRGSLSQNVQSLSTDDPVLESFGTPHSNQGLLARAASGTGLQQQQPQSRLFSSYSWQRQQPMFGADSMGASLFVSGGGNAGPQAEANGDEAEMEGLMATLMCH